MRRWSPPTIFRLSLANAIGFSASTAVPFWISGVGERFGLPPWSGAVIATCQLFCAALLNIATPWLFRGRAPRTIGLAATVVAVLGNLIALIPNPACFAAGAAIAGGALGVLLNTTNRLATQMPSVERAYAVFQITGVLFSISFLLLLPVLVVAFGLGVLFLALAALCALAFINLLSLDFTTEFSAAPAPAAADRTPADSAAVATRLAALIAMALLFIGESSINSFFVPFGHALGLGMATVGRIMAAGLVASLLGGILARVLADRLGIVAPIIGGTLLLAVDVLMVTGVRSVPVFTIGAMTYFVCIVFITPYAFSLLARIDAGGRAASIGPAFLMIGVSIGPSVAAYAATTLGMPAIGWIACTAILLSTLLFAVAGIRGRRAAAAI